MEIDAIPCSPLYIACRNGDIQAVKRLLPTVKSHEISRLEPNGSTPLHAASYHGHTEIVKLLVQRNCARAQRNRFSLTAYEEAASAEIQDTLRRPRESNRFEAFSNDCEWINDNFDGIWKNILNPGRLFECNEDTEEVIQQRQNCVLEWLRENLENEDECNLITSYFLEGFRNNSAEALIKAYTEETKFFKELNRQLAALRTDENTVYSELNAPLIIARTFFRCVYYARHAQNSTDVLYRAVTYSHDEIRKYKNHVGKGPIKTKTFWSTSKSREEAESVCPKHNVLFILTARDPSCRRTLDIAALSAFTYEQEVLIVPLTYMQVTSVKKKRGSILIKRSGTKYEIKIIYWDW